jgi:hypothetical protein
MSLYPLFQQTFPWEGRCAAPLSLPKGRDKFVDRPPSHCRAAQRPSHKGRGFYQGMLARKLAPPIILLFADFASSRETILPFALKPNFETFGFLNKAWYAEPHDFPSVGVPTSVGLHFDRGAPAESSGAGMALILDMKPKFLSWQVRPKGRI